MKRAALALVVVLVLFGGAGLMLIRLHDLSDALMEDTVALMDAASSGDLALCRVRYRALSDRWKNDEKRLIPLVGRVHTDAISITLYRTGRRIEAEDTGELLAELAELEAHIDRMWRSEALLIENLL